MDSVGHRHSLAGALKLTAELPVPFASVSQTCGSVSKELEKRPRRCFRYPRTFCGFDNFLCE